MLSSKLSKGSDTVRILMDNGEISHGYYEYASEKKHSRMKFGLMRHFTARLCCDVNMFRYLNDNSPAGPPAQLVSYHEGIAEKRKSSQRTAIPAICEEQEEEAREASFHEVELNEEQAKIEHIM